MLVLARKPNQSIMIGDTIEIHVVEVKGDQVKLGINAPREVKVFRREIYEDMKQANRDAIVAKAPQDLQNIGKILIRKKKNPNEAE